MSFGYLAAWCLSAGSNSDVFSKDSELFLFSSGRVRKPFALKRKAQTGVTKKSTAHQSQPLFSYLNQLMRTQAAPSATSEPGITGAGKC